MKQEIFTVAGLVAVAPLPVLGSVAVTVSDLVEVPVMGAEFVYVTPRRIDCQSASAKFVAARVNVPVVVLYTKVTPLLVARA
jgi:hypothetical protein